ncbi:MAG: hypothetical protein ACYT04_08085 [Nostoc sp.]
MANLVNEFPLAEDVV